MQKTPMHRKSTSVAALLAVASVMPVTLTVAQAGEGSSAGDTGSLSGLAHKEMLRRQQAVAESDRLRDEGREAYEKGDYKQAYDKMSESLTILPDAPMVQDRRQFLIQERSKVATALGESYRKVGKYDEARQLADDTLKVDPNNAAAKTLISYLDDPIRTNPALTEEHTKNVDEVRRGLYTAEGAYNLGKFDQAEREYQKVLRIDPYNSAARRGMERNAQARSEYYRAAYDHTRSELLSQVDAAWELAVPAELPANLGGGSGVSEDSTGVTYIMQKLRTIVIPQVDFDNTSIEEAVDFLRLRSVELDPERRGLNIVVRGPRAGATGDAGLDADAGAGLGTGGPGSLRVKSLRLTNLPLAEVLKYVCDATGLRYKVDEYAVTLLPLDGGGTDDLYNRTFTVPPDFISRIGGGGEDGGAAEEDPFGGSSDGASANRLGRRKKVDEVLKEKGITFPEGATATLTGSKLVIRNTPNNIDLIESLVEATINQGEKQVKISTKFVEVSQENTDELGFDWIVTPFGIGGDGFLGGGTVGSGQGRGAADFVSPVDGVPIGGIPTETGTNVSNLVTGSNRTGSGAINGNSIDALLDNPNRNAQTDQAAPGILSLTGVFSNSQVQMIMRGLAQKKGTDLMTAPSVTARSGEKATIEIVREFIYPTEYEPPELPNTVGATGGLGEGGAGLFPVTPATPTSFETKNTGVTLEVEPTLGDNAFVIDLRFAPQIVEFEGFVNYGSPIQSPASDALGNAITVTITDNRIEMPVFSARRVNTSLTIFDGYTVAVGGLMREDVQTVDDKVPVLGDIPLVGRLFQTKAENRIKSNLIIFVTAQIIDATGTPIRSNAAGGAVPDGGVPVDLPGSLLPPTQ